MRKNEQIIIRDEIVTEILQKAKEDKDFKKMLFDNPQAALRQFGVIMPDASGEQYVEKIYAMYERAAFYAWFYKSILNELREEDALTPDLRRTDTQHEDMDWDFEVTKYDS